MQILRAVTATFILFASTKALQAQNCCIPKLDENQPYVARLIGGIQSATVLLIVVPYILIGSMALRFYRRGTEKSSGETTHSVNCPADREDQNHPLVRR
jgi:hypothetical protein